MRQMSVDSMPSSVPDPPLLDLVLYPNPPLGDYGMLVVMLCAGVVGGGVGVAFAAFGAWPVTGFLGLDLILLGVALHLARRRGRCVEVIRLDAQGLVVRRLGAAGQALGELRLEPYWVQVILDDRQRYCPRLALRSHGRTVPIGAFLPPAEKREIAAELLSALARRRAQPSSPSTSTMP